METLLVKMFATALALSQVAITPDAVTTQFDRTRDQPQVARLLQAGCAHMRKAFDIEDINLDDLIATALEDPQAVTDEIKVFRGINFADLQTAYRQFCQGEQVPKPAVDLGEVIDVYNKAAADLPDHVKLRGLKLPGASIVLDGKGNRFAEVFEENQRRVWVALADIPEPVRNAFIAAEDKRFYEHKGVDERGLIRAFIANLAGSRRPQGGSTITQQVVKNLLVGDDLSYERKVREMIVASRLEQALSKDEILELYLNFVFLGRGAWGIEMAAQSYFDKSATELTLEEGALLAGLTKGPNYYSPDRYPGRAQERLAYVLNRMQEDGAIGPEQTSRKLPELPAFAAYKPRRDFGFHFSDQIAREAKAAAGIDAITADSYTVRSTINTQLQRALEQELQEGLSRYERSAGRVSFRSAEGNLAAAIRRIEAKRQATDKKPAWQQALASARLPLYDVHWTAAVVLEKPNGRRGEAWRVGLSDGRILPLSIDNGTAQKKLALHDVVFVRVTEGKSKSAARAELRVRPVVQGMAVVLENKTGRILAMSGGFSYPLSQLNRVIQSQRQPGSAIKPLSYLAALGNGLQPNTLVLDEPITLPPIGTGRFREADYWTPKNYDGGGGGTLTLRRALENSRNLATVRLLDGGIESKPEASLDRFCALAHRNPSLSRVRALLSDRARRAAGAADRPRGLLRGDRERRRASRAARHRYHRAQRPHHLSPRSDIGDRGQVGRPRRLLSAQDHAARRAGAGHGPLDGGAFALCRRQDRHHRQRERRLVRGLHQRGHRGGVGRLRQRRRQAAHARRRRHRRPHRGADLRADHAGGVGACRAQDRAGAAVARSQAPAHRARRSTPKPAERARAASR